VHSESASGAGEHGAGGLAGSGYGERAETYLRLLAEAALRPAAEVRADNVVRAADILVDAGVLTADMANRIVVDLQLALRVRGRRQVRTTQLRRLRHFQPALRLGEPGGSARHWRVLPAGPATPGSRLMALFIAADRAIAPTTLYFPPEIDPLEGGVPPFAQVTGTDNLGNSYRLGFGDGTWTGSAWTGPVMFYPAPPATAAWLEITSPNGPLLRADLTVAPRDDTASVACDPVSESPGERVLARQAEVMLATSALSYPLGTNEPGIAELVATLEGAGALSPLSVAPARLFALAQLLGLPARERPPAERVPVRWLDVMAYYGHRRSHAPLAGTAAIGAVLPVVDGARMAIAGLRSGGSGTFLHLLVSGLGPLPARRQPGPPWDAGFSWWVRDDTGGWHLGAIEDVTPAGGPEGLLRIALLPPLRHATTTLTVQIAGNTQQVTAELPVYW
jgi:hypothetical protein